MLWNYRPWHILIKYHVLHKNWDNLCFRIMACYKEWNFNFWGSLTSCCHSVLMASAKNGRMPFYLVLCQVFAWCAIFFFVKVFRFSWEEMSLLSVLSVFLPPSHLYTLLATPTTKYFHLEDAGAHLVCWHQRPSGAKVSNWGSSSARVLSVVATAVGEWQWVCRVFLAQMEGPSFSKVLDKKKWSCLHFQASFLADLPFCCHLRQFKGAPSLTSICICYLRLPALLLTFPSSS